MIPIFYIRKQICTVSLFHYLLFTLSTRPTNNTRLHIIKRNVITPIIGCDEQESRKVNISRTLAPILQGKWQNCLSHSQKEAVLPACLKASRTASFGLFLLAHFHYVSSCFTVIHLVYVTLSILSTRQVAVNRRGLFASEHVLERT